MPAGNGIFRQSPQSSLNAAQQQQNHIQAHQGYWTTGTMSGIGSTITNYEDENKRKITVCEALLKFSLYEHGIPKEKHAEFVGNNIIWIIELYQSNSPHDFLVKFQERLPKEKFKSDLNTILDE